LIVLPTVGSPQSFDPIVVATVTRAPFSLVERGKETGFSLDLWSEVAQGIGRETKIIRFEQFVDMLDAVETGRADLAVANISVTSAREEVFDFSRPIFASGLQIMVPAGGNSLSIWSILFLTDVFLAVIGAFALLFGGGMIMWRLERNAQPYFEGTAKQTAFLAFWWALNLVVNGGFEERVPRTALGRILRTFLVVASLFLVSVFVAKITSVLTVNAITSSINGPDDLYGQRVATVEDSTAAAFLDRRDIRHVGYEGLGGLLETFESGKADAAVFDSPVLTYYTSTIGEGVVQMARPVFMRENYGFALASGSSLAEPVNRLLLRLREDGT
jgi:polar amino acid transport system substrate-binding protein